MRCGVLYLVTIMDWTTGRVLAWRPSNKMATEVCIEALENGLMFHGRHEVFNTDQGGQPTNQRFTQILIDAAMKVSMGGRGRWIRSRDMA